MPVPVAPPGSSSLSVSVDVREDDEGGVVFVWGMATWCWRPGDVVGRRLAAVQLVVTGAAKPLVDVIFEGSSFVYTVDELLTVQANNHLLVARHFMSESDNGFAPTTTKAVPQGQTETGSSSTEQAVGGMIGTCLVDNLDIGQRRWRPQHRLDRILEHR